MVVQKDKEEVDKLAEYNFTPQISKRAKQKPKQNVQKLHAGWKDPSHCAIRERRMKEKHDEHNDKTNRELTFSPALNGRSRDIHKMVHQDHREAHERLHKPSCNVRMEARVKGKMEAPKSYTPQITVRGIQKGFERSGENVFHRLHHGPRHEAVFADPAVDASEDEIVHQTTERLLKSRKPHGISSKSWAKVQQTQVAASEELRAKRAAEDSERELSPDPSPSSTGFPGQTLAIESQGEESPRSLDMFSHSELVSPNDAKPLLSARSTAAPSSVGAQLQFSGRASLASNMPGSSPSDLPRDSVSGTPGGSEASTSLGGAGSGGASALAGKMRASMMAKGGDAAALAAKLSPAPGAAFPGPGEEEDEWPPADSPAEGDLGWPTVIVTGTPTLMGLLTRCERVVKMSALSNEGNQPEIHNLLPT